MRKVALAIALLCGVLSPAIASGPSVVHTSTCDSGSTPTTSFTCSITTPSTGNVLIELMATNGTNTVSGSSSQTSIDAGGTNAHISAFYLLVGGSPPTSQSFSISTAASWGGVVYEVSGLNASNPVDTDHVTGFLSSTTCSPSSITPLASGELLVMSASNVTATATGSASSSPSNTFTTTHETGASGPAIWNDSAWAVYSGTSALTATWTYSPAQSGGCIAIFFQIPTQGGGQVIGGDPLWAFRLLRG